MTKIAACLFAAMMATVSLSAFAGSHSAAPKDCKKDDAREACKKMDEKK
jgi:hypothetical protein